MGNESFSDTTIVILGQHVLRIENYKRILQYSDHNIQIMANKYRMSIRGEDLVIHYYDSDEMEIAGLIYHVAFEQGGGR